MLLTKVYLLLTATAFVAASKLLVPDGQRLNSRWCTCLDPDNGVPDPTGNITAAVCSKYISSGAEFSDDDLEDNNGNVLKLCVGIGYEHLEKFRRECRKLYGGRNAGELAGAQCCEDNNDSYKALCLLCNGMKEGDTSNCDIPPGYPHD